MIVNLITTNVEVIPELNAVNLTITPILSSGVGGGGGDVTKAYVDQQDLLKVDKVLGKGLSENDFTDELKSQYDESALNSHTHVNKLVLDNIEVAFTDELNTELTTSFEHSQESGNPHQTSHDLLIDKNGNLAYQHIDETVEKANPIDNDGLALWDSISLKFVRTKLSDFKTFLANIFVQKTRTINGLDLTENRNLVEALGYSMSDTTSDITLGVKQPCASVPYNFTITGIRAQLGTAAVGILLLTLDVKLNGVSILSTKLTFDSGEKLSETASIPYVLTSPSIPVLTSDAIELSVTQAGGPTTAAKNLTLFLIGYKTI